MWDFDRCAVVVAHPDDETLWAGGTMLLHRQSSWRIVTLCRGGDAERREKFYRVCEMLGADGAMADLDDGPDQTPLDAVLVRRAVLELLGGASYDLVLTHGPRGEYTRHVRHEEVSKAVVELLDSSQLCSREVWMFDYEDGGKAYLPRAAADADVRVSLPDDIWAEKYSLITDVYGFSAESFEARTTPREESFSVFGRRKAGYRSDNRTTRR